MSLGARIKEIRKDNAITQSDFAERMLVTASYISKVESGKEQPSDIFLKLMSLEFNISLDWIKNGEGEKEITSKEYDYFERYENYNKIIKNELINFHQMVDSLPKGAESSILFMLNEYAHLLESKYLKDSQKAMLVSIMSDILASINSLIDKFFDIDSNDTEALLRYEIFFIKHIKEFIDKLNEIKNTLMPDNL